MPAWLKDEDIWDRAKKAADKSVNKSDKFYWATVTKIYKNMGGRIKKSLNINGGTMKLKGKFGQNMADVIASLKMIQSDNKMPTDLKKSLSNDIIRDNYNLIKATLDEHQDKFGDVAKKLASQYESMDHDSRKDALNELIGHEKNIAAKGGHGDDVAKEAQEKYKDSLTPDEPEKKNKDDDSDKTQIESEKQTDVTKSDDDKDSDDQDDTNVPTDKDDPSKVAKSSSKDSDDEDDDSDEDDDTEYEDYEDDDSDDSDEDDDSEDDSDDDDDSDEENLKNLSILVDRVNSGEASDDEKDLLNDILDSYEDDISDVVEDDDSDKDSDDKSKGDKDSDKKSLNDPNQDQGGASADEENTSPSLGTLEAQDLGSKLAKAKELLKKAETLIAESGVNMGQQSTQDVGSKLENTAKSLKKAETTVSDTSAPELEANQPVGSKLELQKRLKAMGLKKSETTVSEDSVGLGKLDNQAMGSKLESLQKKIHSITLKKAKLLRKAETLISEDQVGLGKIDNQDMGSKLENLQKRIGKLSLKKCAMMKSYRALKKSDGGPIGPTSMQDSGGKDEDKDNKGKGDLGKSNGLKKAVDSALSEILEAVAQPSIAPIAIHASLEKDNEDSVAKDLSKEELSDYLGALVRSMYFPFCPVEGHSLLNISTDSENAERKQCQQIYDSIIMRMAENSPEGNLIKQAVRSVNFTLDYVKSQCDLAKSLSPSGRIETLNKAIMGTSTKVGRVSARVDKDTNVEYKNPRLKNLTPKPNAPRDIKSKVVTAFGLQKSVLDKALKPYYDAEYERLNKAYLGFDKLVEKLKSQGKSEESAKKIAAFIGRRKYSKPVFQGMAAAGRK